MGNAHTNKAFFSTADHSLQGTQRISVRQLKFGWRTELRQKHRTSRHVLRIDLCWLFSLWIAGFFLFAGVAPFSLQRFSNLPLLLPTMTPSLNLSALKSFIDAEFDATALPAIMEAVRVPSQSPNFDPEVLTNGLQEQVLEILLGWVAKQMVSGMSVHVNKIEGRTPLLFIEIPAFGGYATPSDTILLYGHADKQPPGPLDTWHEGLHPYIPVIRNNNGEDYLYGRAGADDLYALFASLLAIQGLQRQNAPHPRCVVLIEFSEESGSPDLEAHIQSLKSRIGTPFLVVCLDSGTVGYDVLSVTTSLRGVCVGTLKVEVASVGSHSGDASGIMPDSFMIARHLLDRVEDSATGNVRLRELHVEIPEERSAQAGALAQNLGRSEVIDRYPFLEGVRAIDGYSLHEYVLNRTWRPTVTVVGADGLPSVQNGGNVLRPFTTLKVSVRLPPTLDAAVAAAALERELCRDPPHGAKVTADFTGHGASGWNAPATKPWMHAAIKAASDNVFHKDYLGYGEGGSIPFMGFLGRTYPEAQFLITGVLGPGNCCHGPNENMNIPYTKKITNVVAQVIAFAGHNYSHK
eukprot:ANDGO_06342.mRNA.1 Cys-Gly metallodipeptidase DUG1